MKNISYISRFAVFIAALYCLIKDQVSDPAQVSFMQVGYILTLAHGLTHIITAYNDNSDLKKIANWACFMCKCMFISLAATEVWLLHGIVGPEAAWVHTGLGALVVVSKFMKEDNKEMVDAVITVCAISQGAVGVLQKDYFALSAAVLYAIGYTAFRDSRDFLKIPGEDWFNFLCGASALIMLRVTKGSF